MDKSEQRILIKYFPMKGLGSRLLHGQMKYIPHDSAHRLSAVERGLTRFKTGVARCNNNPRPRRPSSDFGSSLAAFFLEFPFADVCQMSIHFRISSCTIKEILSRQLGPRKFSRRRVPYRLSDDQKATQGRP
jgi:hypothetical protein